MKDKTIGYGNNSEEFQVKFKLTMRGFVLLRLLTKV